MDEIVFPALGDGVVTTEAEKWLERIGKLYASVRASGEELESQLELMDIVMGGLFLHLGRDDRIMISRFPDDDSDSLREYPVAEKPEEPGFDCGDRRIEFADGSALVVFSVWIELGVHASRLDGDDPHLPFLFVEWGDPESRPLPGGRMQ